MAEDSAGVQQRITSFWNMVAAGYDTPDNVAAVGSAGYARWVEAIGTVLPDRSVRVLDVGTGTGFAARIAAELGHEVTGIDTAEQMVELATGNVPAARFRQGDAVRPPFGRGSFEVVFSRSLVWTLRELDTAFANWFELLAPSGRVVAIYGLIDPATDEAGNDDAGSDDTDEDTGDEVGNVFTEYYTPVTTAALPAMRLDSHERLIAAARAAGFTDIETIALESVRGWETSPDTQQPYALIGHRPARTPA